MKKIWITSCALLLAACGDDSDVKKIVVENLKDRESARFYNAVVYSNARDRACVEYNAKNSFGGYGNSSKAELRKVKGTWTLVSMDASCSKEQFDADAKRDIIEEAILRLRKECPKCKTRQQLNEEINNINGINVTALWDEFESLRSKNDISGECKKTKDAFVTSTYLSRRYEHWNMQRRTQEMAWGDIKWMDDKIKSRISPLSIATEYTSGLDSDMPVETFSVYTEDVKAIVSNLKNGVCIADSDPNFGRDTDADGKRGNRYD